MNTLDPLHCGDLRGARQVKLNCGLEKFPQALFELADTLEILDLSGNALTSLPDDLNRLHKLRILFCSDNQFTQLPEVLGHCPNLDMVGFKANQIRTVSGKALPPQLRWLILTDNRINELPAQLGDCAQLQKLMLSGNQLKTLPPELSRCSRLELLRIAANQLAELPAWLMTMPRLSWLAYAGNPFCEDLESAAQLATSLTPIPWDELHIMQRLGEGASGVIYRAEISHYEQVQPVAVKIFKGDVTSDGLPLSEMTACIKAGTHPSLIPVLGQITHHPTGAYGLVMSLIETRFCNLAGPPSLESCTRDVYAQGMRFDLETVIRIALGIAAAARHLHQRGIMHGDLYAHNILYEEQGQVLLGDFGAASFYPPSPSAPHSGLQRLEVRAFGCLLEELLDRCEKPAGSSDGLNALHQLKTRCLSDIPESRPWFQEIEQVLDLLASACASRGPEPTEKIPLPPQSFQ